MEEHLLLAVPASFDSNKRATKYRLSVDDVRGNVHLQPQFPGVPLKKFKDDPFIVLRAHNDTRERVEAICPVSYTHLTQIWSTYFPHIQ